MLISFVKAELYANMSALIYSSAVRHLGSFYLGYCENVAINMGAWLSLEGALFPLDV